MRGEFVLNEKNAYTGYWTGLKNMASMKDRIFIGWEQAFEAGPKVVGGKGWNLGRLVRYGFRVPHGGVLIAPVYEEFIEHNGLRECMKSVAHAVTLDNCVSSTADDLLSKMREAITNGVFPASLKASLSSALQPAGLLDKPLAIRSSATCEDSDKASFAGIHDTFLNVTGFENILTAIKYCYASLWTSRAVAYRRKMGFSDFDVALAVVIMVMVKAESAGVAFSCDPATGREDLVVINAAFGLGDAVVGGIVEPDEYRVQTRLMTLLPRIDGVRTGRKEGKSVAVPDGGTRFVVGEEPGRRVLSDDEAEHLSLIVGRIFSALGEGEVHQDVEWVYDGREFFIVQARPVTALARLTFSELRDQPDIWSNANSRDALPMVQSTLNWSFYRPIADLLFDIPLFSGGYQVPDGLPHLRLYRGRVYFNLTALQWSSYDGFGFTPARMNGLMGGHQPEIKVPEGSPFRGLAGPKRIWRNLRCFKALGGIKRNLAASFARVEDATERLRTKGYSHLSDREFPAAYAEIAKEIRVYAPVFGLLFSSTSFPAMLLIQLLEKGFPGEGHSLANALLAGSADITSAAHGYRLAELAEMVLNDPDAARFFAANPFDPCGWEALPETSPFKTAFRIFLDEYGHRGVYELDVINPRWREEPAWLLEVVRDSIATVDLSALRERQREAREKAERKIARLSLPRRIAVNYWLREARKGAELREMSKSVFAMFYEPIRLLFLEAGGRLAKRGILAERDDVFHCTSQELFSVLNGEGAGGGLRLLVTERKNRRRELEGVLPPDLVIDEIPQHGETAAVPANSGSVLTGLGVATGRMEGRGRIVRDPLEGGRLSPGEVLVAPSTDPAWTPLFLRAAGIVMETGGFLSHGAIVAREYGIPAVVNIPGVLQVIEDGHCITVDGDAGKVYLQD